jgi:membrane associated rhomboid family serine protease
MHVHPWEAPDLFPPRPTWSAYGYLAGNKLLGCSLAELKTKCSQAQVPSVSLVWTPEHDRMVCPAQATELQASAAAEVRGLGALSVVSSVLFTFMLISGWWSAPARWPFFLSMIVMTGVVPIWLALKQRRAPVVTPSPDSLRFSYWISALPTPATLTLAATLVATTVIQLTNLKAAVQSAGLVKTHALGLEAWRLVTGPMLHGSAMHLLFNVGALVGLGSMIEALAGSARVGLVFLLSVIGGSVLSALTFDAPSVGASGGIMGLLGFLLVVGRRHQAELPVPLAATLLRSGFAIALSGLVAYQYIDNAAHGGGFVVGLLLGVISDRGPSLPLAPGTLSTVLGWGCVAGTVAAGAGAALAMTHGPVAPTLVVLATLAVTRFARSRRAQLDLALAPSASAAQGSTASV